MTPIHLPENIAKIEPYVPGKPIEEVERELGLVNSVKLASNENPLGPSPRAIEACRRNLAGVHRYPDGSGYYLRKRLGELHGLPIEQILLGNGSAELVEILARTFLGREGNAIMAEGAFIMYRLAVMAVNGNARMVPLRDHRHDLTAMAASIDEKTRIVFIANPNNPTGTYVSRDDVGRFLDSVPPEVLVVIDEAYHEYVEADDYAGGLEWLKQGKRIAILRTFSKIHGLAGLRIGYALTEADVRIAAEKVRSPFNTGTLGQAGALAALQDLEHVERSRQHNNRELRFLSGELDRRGIHYIPSVANFLLIDTNQNGEEVYHRLLARGVIVRPMAPYGFESSLRVTVGTHAENEVFLQALDAVLAAGPEIPGR